MQILPRGRTHCACAVRAAGRCQGQRRRWLPWGRGRRNAAQGARERRRPERPGAGAGQCLNMLTSTCSMKSVPFQDVSLKAYTKWNVHNLVNPDITGRKKSKPIKANFFGIEFLEHQEWMNWELGIASTKHLILKNVQFKTQKLKFRPPSTEFFTTLFPKLVVLGAGTSFSLPVTFCGLEKKDYEDRIVFESKSGSFVVRLRASLPSYDLHIPEMLCLPVCGVFETSETIFYLCNNSQLPTCFRLEVPSPFFLVPSSGILPPWDDYKIKVLFQPQIPKFFDAIATCKFGDDDRVKYMELQAIAKYPHLLVSARGELSQTSEQEDTQSVLNFGHVAIGSAVEKYMEIHNYAMVNTSFRILQFKRPAPLQSEFTCEIREGTVQASSRFQVPITFMPQTVGAQSVDYFHVTRPGNSSKAVLKVVGMCKGTDCFSRDKVKLRQHRNLKQGTNGNISKFADDMKLDGNVSGEEEVKQLRGDLDKLSPVVALADLKLSFGCVLLGETVTYTTEISNTSDVPTVYQFEIDCSQSVFMIEQPCGVLGGESTQKLRVTFRPSHSINYYRRVTCLIHHQDPLFLDLIGTCHSSQMMPAILKPKHIELYRTNTIRGLTFYPPDILSMMLQEGKLQLEADGSLMLAPEHCCITPEKNLDEDCPKSPGLFPSIPSIIEYFDDGIQSDVTMFPPHISVNERELDFGKCHVPDQIAPLPLTMMNHTKGKVTILWTSMPGSFFTVVPQTIDIPPLKNMAFRIHFAPEKLNMLYGAELECFAYYKVLRDHRFVDDNTFCPPWSLTVNVQGHTFQPEQEHFIPKYTLDSAEMVLPAVNEKGIIYKTLLLKNTGNLPIMFSLDTQHDTAIKIKPTVGFVLPQTYQIFTVRGAPQNESLTKHSLLLHLNASEKYKQEIRLYSAVENPLLALDGDGYLYFKPTCIGTISERFYLIKNLSRMPLYFQWKISASSSRVLSVKPNFGIIQANESLTQTWSFYPQAKQKYFLKPYIFVWGVKGPYCPDLGKKIRLTLRVIGEGTKGRIMAEKNHIDLGEILIGDIKSDDLVLVNNEACSLNFALNVKQEITGLCDPDVVVKDPMAIELKSHNGTIPARSKVNFRFTVRPVRRLRYTWTISSKIISAQVLEPDESEEGNHTCCVTAYGVYPMISISDARCLGSIRGISKQQLWRLFSLDTLNEYLQRDPTEGELLYRVPTRHSTNRCPSVSTPVMVDFNFGAAPMCSDPSIILLMMENKEVTPVNWAFLFPKDQQLDLEYWAETGEFDPIEMHEMRIDDNRLFTVEPKSGRLFPGQQETIQLTYRHEYTGTDRIPVLLKLSHGREILLNFIGITVPKGRPYIHFLVTHHKFAPVCISTSNPPKQIYELYNGGSARVIYDIQLDSVKEVQEQNYSHPIFKCLNPRGEIKPGMTAYIEWIFSPLEARSYSVNVPIHILSGDSALVTFTGIGYDTRVLGNSASFNDPSSYFGAPAVQRAPVLGQLRQISEHYEFRATFNDMLWDRLVGGVNNEVTQRKLLAEADIIFKKVLEIVLAMVRAEKNAKELPSMQNAAVHRLGREAAVSSGAKNEDVILMFLSEERISFGNVPVFTKSSRMIFLYNISETEVISYKWYATSAHISEVLNVTPVCGVLHPGDSTHCIVTLRSHKTPCFYDLDLICEVYSKRQVTQYQKELQEWEKEKDRQQVEFTITERGLQPNQPPVRQRQCCKELQERHKMTHKDVAPKIMKYKTLPPIKEPMETWEGQHSRKPVAGMWLKPMPAKPFLLHLGVTARSHSMEEYHKNFPFDVPKHYIMRHLISEPLSANSEPGGSGKIWGKWEDNSVDPLLSASNENMRLVTDILTTVLRCLQEDIHFQRVLVEGTTEPIPYYRQFWSEEGEELTMKSKELASIQDMDTAWDQESDHIQPKETKSEVLPTVPATTDTSQGQEPDLTQPIEADTELTLTVTVNGGEQGQDQEADSSQRIETEGEEVSTLAESSDEGQSQEPENAQLTEVEEELTLNLQSIDGGQGQEADDAQPTESEEETTSIVSATADVNQSLDVVGTDAEEEWQSEGVQASLSAIRLEEQLARRRHLKSSRHPEFCDLLESILENTLQNILIEASRGEVVLTARPRMVSLPPVTSRSTLGPLSIQDASLSKEELEQSVSTPQELEINSSEKNIDLDFSASQFSTLFRRRRPASIAAMSVIAATQDGIPLDKKLSPNRFNNRNFSLTSLSGTSTRTI
ncbi:cilia- and flagella-associated protein 65 [Mustelus asterias]